MADNWAWAWARGGGGAGRLSASYLLNCLFRRQTEKTTTQASVAKVTRIFTSLSFLNESVEQAKSVFATVLINTETFFAPLKSFYSK